MTVPAAKLTVPAQSGFELVYPLALRATADPVFQDPRAATEPAILIVWPTTVVTSSSKVTATEVAAVQEEVVVVVALDEVEVLVEVVEVVALDVVLVEPGRLG